MPFAPTTLRNLVPIFLATAMGTGLHAEPDAKLRVATHTGGLAFDLTDTTGTGPWILQHSLDGRSWEDVTFWEDAKAGSEPPELVIQRAALRVPDAREGLFRAIQLAEADPFRRRFLSERTKWRLSGISSYQYDLSQSFGRVSWRGIVNVSDNAVTSSATIDFQPPFLNPPEIPTIDELFDRIADAIAADAHEITVTWDQGTGAPLTCYIDLEEFIADEESRWSILRIGDQPDPTLQIETRPDGLAFSLAGTAGTSPWLLQHSHDGRNWEDLQFWESGAEGAEPPELEIPWDVLSAADADGGLFRAIQLAIDDPFRRQFLAERTKWRLSGIRTYQYELSQDFGQISWQGIVNVIDGEVASFITLNQWPPGFEPDVPTIEGLFDSIANAIAANAVTINVTWDPVHGAPLTCYIDISELLADEERGWRILSLTPAP